MLGPEALSHIDSAKSPPSFPNCRQPSSLRSMYCSSSIRKTVEEPKLLGVLMIPDDCVSMALPAVNSTLLHPVMVGSSNTAGQETVGVFSLVVSKVVSEDVSEVVSEVVFVGDEQDSKRISCNRIESNNNNEKVLFHTPLNDEKNDENIPPG